LFVGNISNYGEALRAYLGILNRELFFCIENHYHNGLILSGIFWYLYY